MAAANGGGPATVDRLSARLVRTIYAVPLVVVLVMGLVFWRPWLEPWWPAQHQATSLPRACALADEAGPRLVPGGQRVYDQHNDYTYSVTSRCSVLDPGSGPGLEIELSLQRRTFGQSGTDEGRDEFASERSALRGTRTPVPGLGDEALQVVGTDGREKTVQLLVRRANVVIVLKYEAQRPAEQLAAELQAVARTAISRIRTK